MSPNEDRQLRAGGATPPIRRGIPEEWRLKAAKKLGGVDAVPQVFSFSFLSFSIMSCSFLHLIGKGGRRAREWVVARGFTAVADAPFVCGLRLKLPSGQKFGTSNANGCDKRHFSGFLSARAIKEESSLPRC